MKIRNTLGYLVSAHRLRITDLGSCCLGQSWRSNHEIYKYNEENLRDLSSYLYKELCGRGLSIKTLTTRNGLLKIDVFRVFSKKSIHSEFFVWNVIQNWICIQNPTELLIIAVGTFFWTARKNFFTRWSSEKGYTTGVKKG